MAAAENAGIDFSGNAERVPDGIETDAIVTDEQLAKLQGDGRRRSWRGRGVRVGARQGQVGGRGGGATLLAPPAPTVRVVRADYFTTKGQGFLYVEARTTQGAQTNPVVGMTLENDTGPGTAFVVAARDGRFVDSGAYMFHRNLFKVAAKPSQIRVTSQHRRAGDRQRLASGSRTSRRWTRTPGYQSDFIDDYKTPLQAYARFEEIAQQYPDIAQIVPFPNKTNGYQRKAQATIGGTGQAAVVVSSARVGP